MWRETFAYRRLLRSLPVRVLSCTLLVNSTYGCIGTASATLHSAEAPAAESISTDVPLTQPAATTADEVRAAVASISNDQLEWQVGEYEADRPKLHLAGNRAVAGTATERLARMGRAGDERPVFTREELTPALMEALRDPERFLAAHWILGQLYRDLVREGPRAERTPGEQSRVFEQRPDGALIHHLDGLEVRLKRVPPPERYWSAGGENLNVWRCTWAVRDDQIVSVHERWRHRLAR